MKIYIARASLRPKDLFAKLVKAAPNLFSEDAHTDDARGHFKPNKSPVRKQYILAGAVVTFSFKLSHSEVAKLQPLLKESTHSVAKEEGTTVIPLIDIVKGKCGIATDYSREAEELTIVYRRFAKAA